MLKFSNNPKKYDPKKAVAAPHTRATRYVITPGAYKDWGFAEPRAEHLPRIDPPKATS